MSCSVIFACGFKYSELWLQTHLELFNFCISEHTKVGTLVSFNWIVVFSFLWVLVGSGSCRIWLMPQYMLRVGKFYSSRVSFDI